MVSSTKSKEGKLIAFRDITKVLYNGKIKIDYKDKAHRYYARPRINWDLPESDLKAWGKIIYPKGTTTIIGDTLEKKGLMQWPKGLALRELFGFYDFVSDNLDENGKPIRMTGFSKGVGSLWGKQLFEAEKESLLPMLQSANEAWKRKQKKGADIGSVVHEAIENFIKGNDFDIEENYLWTIKESEFDSEDLRTKAMEEMSIEVEQAKLAFLQFQNWWLKSNPTLHSAEDLLYSLEHNICGTYDADLTIDGKRITADWKTSNASTSKEAAAPEGVYYSYFVQLGFYELMRREMGIPPADDLLTVSARKDGSFSLVYASELGLSVDDCLQWAQCTITCNQLMVRSKKLLLDHPPKVEKLTSVQSDVITNKGEF